MDDIKSKLGNFITGQTLRVCKVNIKSFYEAMSDIVPFFEKMQGQTFASDKAFEKHCNQAIEHYYELAVSHIPGKKKDGYFYLCIHGIDLNLSITYTTTLIDQNHLNSAYEIIESYGFKEFPAEADFEEIHAQDDIAVITTFDDLIQNKEEISARLKNGNGSLILKNKNKATTNEFVRICNEEIFKDIAVINKTELRKISIASYSGIHFCRNDVAYVGLKNQKDIDTLACLFDKAFVVDIR